MRCGSRLLSETLWVRPRWPTPASTTGTVRSTPVISFKAIRGMRDVDERRSFGTTAEPLHYPRRTTCDHPDSSGIAAGENSGDHRPGHSSNKATRQLGSTDSEASHINRQERRAVHIGRGP